MNLRFFNDLEEETMPKSFPLILVSALFFLLHTPLFGQEEEAFSNSITTNMITTSPVNKELPPFTAGFQYGSYVINLTNYNTFRLLPECRYGGFGIGLDLNFEFDANGHIIETEWNTWQAVVTKVSYLRYGIKNDPVFIEAGGIKSYTLGDGFILKGFSNMQNYPVRRINGIVCDLDFHSFGLNAFTENILTLDIAGIRGYYRPLIDQTDSLFQKLEIGATVAADAGPENPSPVPANPYDYSYSFNGQPVIEYGIDASMPWFENKTIQFKTYLDFAGIYGKGTGETLGFSGKAFSFIPYKLEIRILQPEFTPEYFDVVYFASRADKYASLDAVSSSAFGWLFGTGISVFDDRLILFCQAENLFKGDSKPSMLLTLELARSVLNMISLEFTWLRKDLNEFADVFSFEAGKSVFIVDLNYYISDHVSIGVDVRKSFERQAQLEAADSSAVSGGGLVKVRSVEQINMFFFTMLTTRFSF
jgi:hypothetical protein